MDEGAPISAAGALSGDGWRRRTSRLRSEATAPPRNRARPPTQRSRRCSGARSRSRQLVRLPDFSLCDDHDDGGCGAAARRRSHQSRLCRDGARAAVALVADPARDPALEHGSPEGRRGPSDRLASLSQAPFWLCLPVARHTHSRRPMADQTNASTTGSIGRIVEIKGVVLDAVFPDGLPEINHALKIQAPSPDGEGTVELIAEVQQHLGDDRVRAVAMDTTDGLARGTEVVDTGAADLRSCRRSDARARSGTSSATRSTARRPPRASAGRSTAIRRPSTSCRRRSRSSRPGIKVDRPDRAVRPRRQGRPVRRCGRRQDGAHPGADPQRRAAARRRVGVRRRRRAHARGQRPHHRDDGVEASSTRSRSSTGR